MAALAAMPAGRRYGSDSVDSAMMSTPEGNRATINTLSFCRRKAKEVKSHEKYTWQGK